MTEIFISHATADRALARLLVEFLKEAVGVPVASIFCSSLKGHGIPFAEDFNEYMKKQIQKPKLVVLLMTESYLESPFCLMELGASWARSLKSVPVVVPPMSYDTVTKTLGLKQAWLITDYAGLIDLRKLVVERVEVEPRGEHTWDQKRASWRINLKNTLKDLRGATKVSAADHKIEIEKNLEQAREIEALGVLLEQANEKIAMLEATKDPVEVKKIKKSFAGAAELQNEFDSLIEAVSDSRPGHTSNSVFKHIIMDHFGKAPTIDWFHDKEELEQAIQYNLLSADEPHSVEWKKSKLVKLRKAIHAVARFLDSDEGQKVIDDSR